MALSDLSIRNPVFAVMLSAAMVVFGYLGYRDMGVSQFPEVDFPVVSVVITREAASPDIMDGDVTDVVEDAVAGVEGVDYLMSQSLEGTSITTVFFRLERNIDVAMQDVQNAVSAARRRLPLDIDPPVISKVNPNNLPVLWLTLSGPVPLRTISDFAEKEFKQQIAAIPEVGGVQFGGLQARNIRIWVDRDKLTSYNLSADDVRLAIQQQHAELPAGYIKSNLVEFNLRTMGEAYSLDEFRKLLVAERKGQQIYLTDVATVEDGLEDRRSLARYNRMPAVAVGVRKAIGGNLVAVCENVKRELPRLRKMLPPGVELNVPVDTSLFVRENVEELKLTLFLGILLTAGVCFLFLGSFGTTLNICLSIPTSLVGTFFVLNYGMKLLGWKPFTINLMTLLGLSLSVGVVVDDAILVLENIYRHREEGLSRLQAALVGAKEITFAAVAATLSIMAIFLPVAFMTGTIGKFFFQFGVTVSVAVLLSLVCALTLTPMLCAFFLTLREKVPARPRPFGWPLALLAGALAVLVSAGVRLGAGVADSLRAFAWPLTNGLGWGLELAGLVAPWGEPGAAGGAAKAGLWAAELAGAFVLTTLAVRYGGLAYWALDRYFLGPVLLRPTDWVLDRLTAMYRAALEWSLRHWGIVLVQCGVLVGVAVAFLSLDVLGRELVPSEDQSRILVHVICPVGSSIDQVSELLRECETRLETRPEVAGLLTTVATESGQLMNEADIFVQLVPIAQRGKRQQTLMNEIRQELRQIADVRVVVRDQSTEGFTAQRGDPIDFSIQGDWDRLPEYRLKILEQMRNAVSPRDPDRHLFEDIDTDYRPGMPEVRIRPDREKLAMINMTVGHLADSMSLLVGGARVAKYTDKGRRYDVRIRLREQERATPDGLKVMTLRGGNNQLVNVEDVVESIDVVATLPVINRYNHQRKIEVTANPAPGVSQGEAIQKCEEIIKGTVGEECTVVELGNARAMRETITSLVFALLMGIAIAYMILGVQFNSFVHPFTVILAMPFAVTGAVVTLWLTGDTLNMMSMIGLILLMGLVKKNSIILVDYTKQLRAEGKGVREAVLQACPVRLRPILMTSVATVAGAVPAALGLGPGAETRAPMARGIIGGILLSTLVTLLLVPVFYVLVERLRAMSAGLVTAPGARPAGEGVPEAAEGRGRCDLVSIHDSEGLEALRGRCRVDPDAIRRLCNAFYKKGRPADEALLELPEGARQAFAAEVAFHAVEVEARHDSRHDGASKFVVRTGRGRTVETVVLRIASGRTTVCVSSQVGCAVRCSFCATGQMGIAQDLTADEILDQVVRAQHLVRDEGRRVRNVVFMGMGEPLLNEGAVHAALDVLLSPRRFALSAAHVLVSTVGLPEAMVRLAERFPGVGLALSLHSAVQAKRETIIPLARRHALEGLHAAVLEVNALQDRAVMIEYLLLDGVNDGDDDLVALIGWLAGLRVHVNLIPYNPIEGPASGLPGGLRGTPEGRRREFAVGLRAAGLAVTVRYSLGADVAAACGQLVQRQTSTGRTLQAGTSTARGGGGWASQENGGAGRVGQQ